MVDKIFSVIEKEKERQQNTIELIASENFVSENVLKAQGSILTNKYAEGYPGKRYYGGCKFVDEIENMAIDAAKELFGVRFATYNHILVLLLIWLFIALYLKRKTKYFP